MKQTENMKDSEKLRALAVKIFNRNGFDFEAFEFENEFSAKNILASMEEYAEKRIADSLDRQPPSDEEIDVELALKINVLIHNECKDVPHDIGLRIAEMISDRYKAAEPSCDAMGHFGGDPKPEGECPKCGNKW